MNKLKKLLKNKIISTFLLAFLLFSLISYAHQHRFFSNWQNKINDSLYIKKNRVSDDIIIVAIDDKSLKESKMGRFQDWKREYFGQVVENLNKNGAKTIGLDILFPEESKIEGDDQKFCEIIQNYDNVFLGAEYKNNLVPIDSIKEAAKYGYLDIKVDPVDGVLRKIALLTDGIHEYFGLKIAQHYLDIESIPIRFKEGEFFLPTLPQTVIPTTLDKQYMLINYFGTPYTYKKLSFIDVYNNSFKKKWVDGKIVLIGEMATGIQDEHITPVSGIKMPGVEIIANIIQTILQKNFLAYQSNTSVLITMAVIMVSLSFLFVYLRLLYSIIILAAGLFAVTITGIVIFQAGVIVNIFYGWITVLFTFVCVYLFKFVTESQAKKALQMAFSQYVAPSIVKEILKDTSKLKLGGEERYMTAFFSDIKGFTTISEGLSPEQTVRILNEYLDAMTQVIFEEEGTLDKYEGDAIVAFWGAPIKQEDHALKTCRAAIKQQKKLAELRRSWKERENAPEIYVRMGINTGKMVAGNIGSKVHFDYTIIGDDVNLASRLEGANKQFGTKIMISEATYDLVKEYVVSRYLGAIRVKGKVNAVNVYDLIGLKEEVSPDTIDQADFFSVAVKLYQQKKFSEAKQKFNEYQRKRGEDEAAEFYVKECENYIENPPSEGFDGVVELKEK